MRLRAAVRTSKAVVCRSLHQVMALVSTDNELYASFYGQRRAGARRAEDTPVERERLIADNLLFPHYHEEIRFAALSLTNEGVQYYGPCSIVLSDFAFRNRTTVFEKNSVEFCRENRLGAGAPLPPGYRAVWDARDKLAAAKLHGQLKRDDTEKNFQRLLLSNVQQACADFMEVHMYGPIHRRAITDITVDSPATASDEALVLELEKSFLSRICGVILVPGVVPSCDKGQFP
jgi:hypothetical protein